MQRYFMLMDWKNIVKMTPLYSYPQFTNKHMILIFFLKRLPKNNNKLSLSSILLLSYHTWQERFGHHTSERAESHHPLVTSFKQHFNHYSLVSTPTAPWKWPFGSNCQHLGWHIFWLALSKSSVFWTSLKLLWHFFILTSLTFIFPFSSTT